MLYTLCVCNTCSKCLCRRRRQWLSVNYCIHTGALLSLRIAAFTVHISIWAFAMAKRKIDILYIWQQKRGEKTNIHYFVFSIYTLHTPCQCHFFFSIKIIPPSHFALSCGRFANIFQRNVCIPYIVLELEELTILWNTIQFPVQVDKIREKKWRNIC